VVGVNAFLEGNDEPPPPTLRIGAEVEDQQRKRLATVKSDRDDEAVAASLARVRADASEPNTNLMPSMLAAADAYATVGEICETLASVFGRHVEVARI
jgi:Methylmalonyl-CoA mutase, N-terminal domain/subunit